MLAKTDILVTLAPKCKVLLFLLSLGWRPDMQDESIYKLKIFHPKPNIKNSLFCLFDGHGSNNSIIKPIISVYMSDKYFNKH